MSFIFYINNGFATMAGLETYQGYYQNIGGYYSNTDEMYPSQNYPQTWPQNDVFAQNDTKVLPVTQVPKDDAPTPTPSLPLLKPKRRMEKTLEKEILSAKKNS
jgi:hypothetical protein